MTFHDYIDFIKHVNTMATINEYNDGPRVLEVADVRKVYLITYSDADIKVFDRRIFANAVLESFEAVTSAKVTQWACCMERHRAGNKHFHMCVLLDKLHRWLKVKKYLKDNFGIIVNFSGHEGYYKAFNYVIEEDSELILKQKVKQALARAYKIQGETRLYELFSTGGIKRSIN